MVLFLYSWLWRFIIRQGAQIKVLVCSCDIINACSHNTEGLCVDPQVRRTDSQNATDLPLHEEFHSPLGVLHAGVLFITLFSEFIDLLHLALCVVLEVFFT